MRLGGSLRRQQLGDPQRQHSVAGQLRERSEPIALVQVLADQHQGDRDAAFGLALERADGEQLPAITDGRSPAGYDWV